MMFRRSSLARNDAGAVTIELALMAPLLGAMLIGLVDLSTAYSNKLRLEQVAQRAIERVQQGGFTTSKETVLEAEAEAEAGTGSDADLTFWLECNGVRMTDANAYTNGCTTGQAYARYVQLDITQPYTPIITARFGASNSDGTILVRGIAGLRIQ